MPARLALVNRDMSAPCAAPSSFDDRHLLVRSADFEHAQPCAGIGHLRRNRHT